MKVIVRGLFNREKKIKTFNNCELLTTISGDDILRDDVIINRIIDNFKGEIDNVDFFTLSPTIYDSTTFTPTKGIYVKWK
jgi:hypothetical protein